MEHLEWAIVVALILISAWILERFRAGLK